MKKHIMAAALFLSFFSAATNANAERVDSVQVTTCKVSEEKSYCFMKVERIYDDPSTHSKVACNKNEDDEIYPCPKLEDCESNSVNITDAGKELFNYIGDNPERCDQFKVSPLPTRRSGGGR